jgi:hypothetical protein
MHTMPDELRPDLVFAMSDAIDRLLLSWEPAPSLSEAISVLVQSLAQALAVTSDPEPSLVTVVNNLESILVQILQNTGGKPN